MANTDAPRGFIPLLSEGKQIRARKYIKDTAEAIYQGDLVRLASDGEIEPYDNADATCIGVAAEYAAASATSILVYDDPSIVYTAQCDGTFALTNIGNNADVLATNGSGLLSAHEVQSSSFATTVTLPIKIMALHDKPDTNAVGTNAVVQCKINNSQLSGGDGTTGV